MLNESKRDDPARQALSSLMDSDLAADHLPEVVAAWHQDAEQRATWHCYHLIGDVLRSDELARPAARDASMLLALRARLAAEPVPLAPGALAQQAKGPLAGQPAGAAASPQAGRRFGAGRLVAPAALAAGFVIVAGLMVVLKPGGPQGADGGQLAGNGAAPPALAQAVPAINPDAGVLLRSAQLDRYLEAHRKLGTSVAAAGADQRMQIVYESK